MRRQATHSLAAWPAEISSSNGVLVLSGYGVDIRVWRGRLRVADGSGRHRREAIVHRATGRLRRLIVLGHTGTVSLEAIRWLGDVGAGYLQIDADGKVLAAFGHQGTNRPSVRRAQARALDTPIGVAIARRLIEEKIAGQADTLKVLARLAKVDADTVQAIRASVETVRSTKTRDALRAAEAVAAAAYWSAWSRIPVAFARRDISRIPAHWWTFGSRTSPLTGGPRLAANPANAILNYLYALLESEATLAAQLVGLDPGLGVLHADQLNRDSLAADLMEPIRPLVDRFVLQLLSERSFTATDFHETRQGVCRLTPDLARELALTSPLWGRAVGHVAEDVALQLDNGGRRDRGMPTPASGRNRANGRPTGSRTSVVTSVRVARRCSNCGAPTERGRETCSDACDRERRAEGQQAFGQAGARRLRALRAAGIEPVDSEARVRIGARQRERQREENAWNAQHPIRADPEDFRMRVLPAIKGVPLRELSRGTGLSVGYCARIRRGEEVPHARWWAALLATAWQG